MSSPDKFHLARKTPAMTLTDFEANVDMDKLCRYRLARVREQMVAQDLAQILGILTKILEDGIRAGIFIKTVPLIVHMMIIGAIVFFKMTSPIRAKVAPLVATFDKMNTNVSGQVAAEIEMLILNAVRK